MIRLATLLLVLAGLTAAQEFRGGILGRITDASGAVIAGASVRITNVDTNAVAQAASNQDGNYQVPYLLPGNYAVTVEMAGFKRVEQQNVRVSVGTVVTVNVRSRSAPSRSRS